MEQSKQGREEGEWDVGVRGLWPSSINTVTDDTVRQEKVRRILPFIPTAQAGSPSIEKGQPCHKVRKD